ncbi:uncharacterized protein C8A04DRAFT_35081 [Dichotomopilus funicola]|uniref:Zn(2)-C6 fungal-type domain-containing protein n=1 Tax=Dichotomopilus funicola TaxID=1934379 RepID=A0AAN6ZRD6_9PEZI|nr:hypothetical protein C8A04DRAFT_35081 [Dichotomopilus funicola]
MVYCGRPSKGCSNCRGRKIRCDQKAPGCGQCIKRQETCPGYRNITDLMFRDESLHVIKKAKARARRKSKGAIASPVSTPSGSEGRASVTPEPRARLSLVVPPTPGSVTISSSSAGGWGIIPYQNDDSSSLMSPDSGSWPGSPPVAQLYTLPPTCQEQGFAYFFSRYVTADETVSHQRFDFIRDVWKPSSPKVDCHVDVVLASMTAVGLMGLASTAQLPHLMDAARKSYGTALHLTNRALQDPADAVKDSTMLSVLILGVFEMMSENTPRTTTTIEAFQEHVNGAMALARMRGPAQFRTAAGRKMFSMLCQRVVVSCAQRNVPMPDSLIELWDDMVRASPAGSENAEERLLPLKMKVLQLRTEIKSGFLTDPATIVSRSLAIDHDIETMIAGLSPSWHYRAFRLPQQQQPQYHPAVYGDVYHLYPSIQHADAWNHIHCTRILILETVITVITRDLHGPAPTLDAAQYLEVHRTSQRKLEHILSDIIASVPQQLGLITTPPVGSIDSRMEVTHGNDDPHDINNNKPATSPLSTVEIRMTPSPPTSPSNTTSSPITTPIQNAPPPHSRGLTMLDVTGNSSLTPSSPLTGDSLEDNGVKEDDITGNANATEEAERYMLLVSATSTLVWPMYVGGMSSVCGAARRAYVIERMRTLYMETGIRQADVVAGLLERRAAREGDYNCAWG